MILLAAMAKHGTGKKHVQSNIRPPVVFFANTAIVSGKNVGTGIGLVEVYDLDQAADSTLANISTRGFVDTGDNVMIGGVIHRWGY